MLLFGGHGSNAMLRILRDLQSIDRNVQVIAMCGRNSLLAERIRKMPSRITRHVVEFTNDVPCYMRLSDFFIGKPGPGSISEAIAMNLPVIIECNRWTLPQERYNAEWVRKKDIGIVVDDFSEICQAVSRLLEPTRFQQLRANVAAIENRAVFEILDILQRILDGEV